MSGDHLVVCGTDGDDTIQVWVQSTSGGTATLKVGVSNSGGYQDQTFSGVKNLTINGLDGNDKIGSPGDSASFVAVVLNGGVGNDELYGNNGDNTLNGDDGDDLLVGHGGDDAINGGAGNDRVDAGAGDDTVNGGAGNDTINSGADDDTVYGDSGNDVIFGGDGNDWLTGGSNADQIYGEGGDDTIYFDWYGFQDGELVNGGSGTDRLDLMFRNVYGDSLLTTFDSPSSLLGNKVNTFVLNPTSPSAQLKSSTDGYINTSGFESSGVLTGVDGVTYDLTAAIGWIDTASSEVSASSQIPYRDKNNVVIGTTGVDNISTLGGNDIIIGRAGDDVVDAGAGDDVVYGNSGNDTLSTGAGRDKAYGGQGADTINFYYAAYNSGLEIDGGGQAGDTLNINFKSPELYGQLSNSVKAELALFVATPSAGLNLARTSASQYVGLIAKGFKAVNLVNTGV